MRESTEALRLRSTGVVIGSCEHGIDIAVTGHGSDASIDGKLLDSQVEARVRIPIGFII